MTRRAADAARRGVALARAGGPLSPRDGTLDLRIVVEVRWIGVRSGTSPRSLDVRRRRRPFRCQAPKLLAPGDVIDGRYRISAFVAGGGMASVYRATHVVLEQVVAIKVISPLVHAIPGMARRFLREAKAATRMKGAHVAHVSDVGTMPDGAPYIVMEYLDGSDLEAILESGDEIAV